jgi:hypothetical protein
MPWGKLLGKIGGTTMPLSLKKCPVTDRETELPILLRQVIPFSLSEA